MSGIIKKSLAEKELTTSSKCKRKQRHGGILEMQLSKKAGLTVKKPAYLFLSYIPEKVMRINKMIIYSDFVTNSYGESWDSSHEK